MKRKTRVIHKDYLAKKGWRDNLNRFVLSFTPSKFKDYWLSRAGLVRVLRVAGLGILVIFLIFLYFAKDLPSPSKVNAKVAADTTKFYDRTGQTMLYEVYGTKNRSVISFEQMPDNIRQATVAVEDKSFYKHGSFSSVAILRAAIFNLVNRGTYQGGSTITQQLVKNALLTNQRSFSRKIKELILSMEISQFYKKDDILRLYLNEIPYGNNAYGIQAASKTYFDKDAKDLTLDEAAFLAAIPRAPTYYSPYGGNVSKLIARQKYILDLMAEQKYVTQKQADEAKKVNTLAKIPATPKYFANITAPHFVMYVKEQLEAKYGTATVEEGGLKVITTLDLEKQKAAEDAVKKNIARIRSLGGSNAALVAADPKTGQILAMVGSYDYNDPSFGRYNVAIAERQPGSSFKPFVYATAFQKNWGPGSTIYDVTTDFGGGYKPKNYSGGNYGVQSIRSALAGSLNIPAVKALYLAGIGDSLDTARRLGITTLTGSPDKYGLSLVLGTGEVKLTDMVNAYESFANGGLHHEQVNVLKVTNTKGKVLQEYKPSEGKRVLDAQIAYLISNILSDNSARSYIFGSRNSLTLPDRPVAAKTGTTEYYNDAWTMGYTPNLAAGVWAGNNNNRSMTQAASVVSAPIWQDFMTASLTNKKVAVEQFVKPEGIKTITLDANTGKLPAPGVTSLRTDIFPSWYKPEPAVESKDSKIDKVSGKLATECTPILAQQTVKVSAMHAEIPPNDPAYSRWEPPVQALAAKIGYGGSSIAEGTDDVHRCDDVKPTLTLKATPPGPGDSAWTIKITWKSGTFNINKLEVTMDGQIISTQSISSPAGEYTFEQNVPVGSHTISAVVTDAGLYQADSTLPPITGNNNVVTSIFKNKNPGDGSVLTKNVSQTFTWSSAGAGLTYTLIIEKGGNPLSSKSAGSNTSTGFKPTQTGNYSWYVEASNGDRTTATSFSVVQI